MGLEKLIENCDRLVAAFADILDIPAPKVVYYSDEGFINEEVSSENIDRCIKQNTLLAYSSEDDVIFFNMSRFLNQRCCH